MKHDSALVRFGFPCLLCIFLGMGCFSSPHAFYNEGISYVNAQKADKAEAAFLQEVHRNPGNASAWNQLGIIAFEQKRLEDAEIRFHKAFDLDKIQSAYPRNLAMVYAEQQKYDLAEQLLEKSLERNPSDADSYVVQAKVKLLQGKEAEAQESLKKAFDIDPAHPEGMKLKERLGMEGSG